MKKILVFGVGAIGSAAVALTLGSGTALADDAVVGQTFKDAKAALSQQGFTAVVATTVGDRKDWDECIVSSASKAPFRDGSGNSTGNKMQVNLNCYATYGTALWPGFSVASPEGRELHDADVAAKQQKEAAAVAAQAQAQQDQLAATDVQQGG